MSKMTESELKAILSAEIADSIGHLGGELAEQRRKALRLLSRRALRQRAWRGAARWCRPTSPTSSNGSCRRCCASSPPATMSCASSRPGPRTRRWRSRRRSTSTGSSPATIPGFLTFYTLFKDALLQKNGIAKVWWEEDESSDARELPAQELRGDADHPRRSRCRAAGPREYQAERIGIDRTAPMVAAVTYHDLTVKRRRRSGARAHHDRAAGGIPDRRRARSIEEAPFVAHRVRKTVSELIEMGYDRDLVEVCPKRGRRPDGRTARALRVRRRPAIRGGADGLNRAMRESLAHRMLHQCDWDGDGIAERRKVTVGGSGRGDPRQRAVGRAAAVRLAHADPDAAPVLRPVDRRPGDGPAADQVFHPAADPRQPLSQQQRPPHHQRSGQPGRPADGRGPAASCG